MFGILVSGCFGLVFLFLVLYFLFVLVLFFGGVIFIVMVLVVKKLIVLLVIEIVLRLNRLLVRIVMMEKRWIG